MDGLYIYGVVDVTKPLQIEVEGLAGNIRIVTEYGIGAIVGTVPETGVPLDQANIAHRFRHQEVLRAAMPQTTVLPVKFCTIAPDEDTVRRILTDKKALLVSYLKEFTDHLQIEIAVHWDFDQVVGELATTTEIARLHADALSDSEHFEKALSAALDRRRTFLSEEICGVLGTVATDMATRIPDGEHEAAKVSLLLNKCDMGSLEGLLNRLNAEMGEEIDFIATPQPLSSFATVEVSFSPTKSRSLDSLIEASSNANMVMINLVRQKMQARHAHLIARDDRMPVCATFREEVA
jgi:hypothetical protein